MFSIRSVRSLAIAAAIAVVAAVVAMSAPVRSLVGSDGNDYAKGRAATAADYVLDGLVALCDGEENDGWGVHNDTLKGWRNLVTGSLFPNSNIGCPYYWDDKCMVSDVASGWGTAPFMLADTLLPTAIASATYTCEMVYESENTGIFLQHPSTSNRIQFRMARPTICSVSVVVENGVVKASYINGNATASADGITFSTSSPQASATFKFGGWYQGSVGGNLYSIRLYAIALTPGEIRYNYLIDKERFGL